MAGKLHKDFESYYNGGGHVLAPGDRRARCYCEGYAGQLAGKAQGDNPFGLVVDNVDDQARAWDQGFRDANAGLPSTHCGLPTGTPPEPEPDPEPTARRSRR